jgi:hypothetical protein
VSHLVNIIKEHFNIPAFNLVQEKKLGKQRNIAIESKAKHGNNATVEKRFVAAVKILS